ncbi:hypothetical protein PIB30_015990 [Stylosanthes scabra]|uniref:UspA domain-containing protein n=1 Tax=Stylosanthes scabra TaxID=79078 RepID=A0ABU6X7F2_9FABA|nr:hypothetical protein [Stylosanthes scabra]
MAQEAENERRVLVAVDEGDESMYALSWCLNNLVFQNSKNTLILLYVNPPRGGYYMPFETTAALDDPETHPAMERYSQEVADCVLGKAKKLCKDLQHVKVETRVENGDPREVICEMAEKLGAHVLVMGSHGYGLIKRTFLGSVSSHCAQNVKCPVLIVKKPKSIAAAGDEESYHSE